MSLQHSAKYRPRIFPIKGTAVPSEIDRAQTIDPSVALNSEKIEEIGNPSPVGYIKKSPTIGYALGQYENGDIELYQKLVCNDSLGGDGETEIDLDDFKNSYFDICAYLTDDDDTFKGTILYPSLRVGGFSFNVSEPQAIVERSFDLVGEAAFTWQGLNKYYIYQLEDISSDDTDYDITLDKTAAVDPANAGVFMYRVVRISSGGTVTELSLDDADYTEVEDTVTIATVSTGDTIRLFYTSATAPDVMFTVNNTDIVGLLGDSVDVYLYIPASGKPSASDRLVKLQSVALDVSFDRDDLFEIGNKEIAQRGISNSTVTATLSNVLENRTIEEVLQNVAADYPKLDVSQFSDEIALIIKVYSDNTKGTFKYGIKCTGMTPTDIGGGAAVNEYVKGEFTLEGESLLISADSTVIGI